MTSKKKHTIAGIGGFVCAGIFVTGDIIASHGQKNPAVAFKDGGLLGMAGWGVGYALARLVLACIPCDGVAKAVCRGEIGRVRGLLDKGEDINARDFWGNTALCHAARLGNAAMVELLLARGADPKIANLGGKTPRDLSRDDGVVKLLSCESTSRGERE